MKQGESAARLICVKRGGHPGRDTAVMPSLSLASAVLPAPAWPQDGAPQHAQTATPTPLDDPREWDAFSRPRKDHPDQLESSVAVEGMHCAACSLTVEQALLGVPGVVAASVSAGSQRAQVTWRPAQVRPSAWMQAVVAAGYRLVPLQDTGARARRQNHTRQALWRWGVAGLGMMQVMMYAYPAYIAQPGEIPGELEQLLRWASWVITLPVLLFSCGPFFQQAWGDLRQRRVSMDLPVALGIAITFGISTVGTFEPLGPFGREVYFDSLTMFVFFLLSGRWLELRLRDRTAGALEALISRLPDGVERERADGSFERVAARRVAAGDVLRVRAGETFVADALVLDGDTQVDEALLTGESQPVRRGPGASVVAGSHNLSGTVRVRVLRTGAATRFAQIVSLMASAAASKPAAGRLADALARPFLLAVLAAAALAAAWNWGQGPAHALMVAVAVLVVTCPCALSLAAPAALLASAGALARRGIWVRRLQALEVLARVDTVVFDKTGTLTEEAMRVAAIHTRTGVTPQQALAMAGALARHSLHPVSRAAVRRRAGARPAGLAMRPGGGTCRRGPAWRGPKRRADRHANRRVKRRVVRQVARHTVDGAAPGQRGLLPRAGHAARRRHPCAPQRPQGLAGQLRHRRATAATGRAGGGGAAPGRRGGAPDVGRHGAGSGAGGRRRRHPRPAGAMLARRQAGQPAPVASPGPHGGHGG